LDSPKSAKHEQQALHSNTIMKLTNLQNFHIIIFEQQVLGLDVSMCNAAIMQVNQSLGNLEHETIEENRKNKENHKRTNEQTTTTTTTTSNKLTKSPESLESLHTWQMSGAASFS
jgi:hypothetical protein